MTPGHWQPVIEGMLEAVWIVDPLELRIVAANRAAFDLLGLDKGSLIGRPVVEFAATPEDIFFWEDVAAGLSDQIMSETLLRRGDGSTVQVERRVSRIRLDEGVTAYVVGIRDQSEQRRVEAELEKIVAELRATLESTADGILVADMEEGIRGYNHRFAEMWGLPEDLMTRRDDGAVFAWMARSVVDSATYTLRLADIARSPLLETSDAIALRSGRILERVTLPQYSRGRPIGRVYSFRDITQRLADDARLQLASTVFEASLDAIFIADAGHVIVAANPGCARMTGIDTEALIGQRISDVLVSASNNPATLIDDMLGSQNTWQGEAMHHHADGGKLPCMVSLVRLVDDRHGSAQYIVFFKDLSETVAAKRRIEELAYHDALTGLPNRLMLRERMEFSLSLSRRDHTPLAILFIDLDRFKHINDSLGHIFGDRVLVEVAERIKGCLRQADTAARLGGDEFLLLLHQADAHGAEVIARRVIEALSQPFVIDDMTFTVTCSIGIALYPDDGDDIDDLVKNADSAMYHVKERGRGDFRFYQRQMNIDLLSRMKLDQAMRQALASSGFRLHYQPQVDLKTGKIFGAEALLRWHDPVLGEVPPARFIPVAEDTGLIAAIGAWVLEEAVGQAARWHAQGLKLAMAINVSALQFRQTDFVDGVAAALRNHGVAPAMIELELTESILIQDADEAMKRLDALARLGVMLSIDDFGTGYSNLSYLKRFPLHRLKIDRSFVSGLPEDESDAAIVTSIVNLARAMNLRVIAEGVETDIQQQFLLAAGCQEFQGYLCAPALGPDAFLKLIEQTGWNEQPGQIRLFSSG